MIFVVNIFLLVACAAARELSGVELHRLPKLFHLDDYERCLSRADGLYCVGTFELTPSSQPNQIYDLIKEHLNHPYSFDRRLLHRGYCLTSRCPAKETNSTLRFEQCAGKYLQKQGLTARLSKLSYCESHAERKTRELEGPDMPQTIFLYVVYLLLFLNALGTYYDVFAGGEKSSLLVAWSVPSNWRRMVAPYEGGEASFIPIQSAKIILHAIIIYGHCAMLHYFVYSHNPELMEKQARSSSLLITVRNGTSIVQLFLLMSGFLTGHSLLAAARRGPITAGLLARWILKRVFRIAPVFLLVTGYAATWWGRAGSGPLWAPTVRAESQLCRRKFWTHLFFINNLVDASELCLVQSWAMAADIQLYVVCVSLTVVLLKLRWRSTRALAALFAAACAANVARAYLAGLEPMVRVIVPEIIRNRFYQSRTLIYLHLSPMSNLPASLFGLLVAHICFEKQYKRIKPESANTLTNNPEQNKEVKENGQSFLGNDRTTIENGGIYENGGSTMRNSKLAIENRQTEGNAPAKENSEINLNGIVYNGVGLRNRKMVHGNGTNGIHNNQNGLSESQNDERTSHENIIISTVKESDNKTSGIKINVAEILHGAFTRNGLDTKTNSCFTQNGIVKTNELIEESGTEISSNGYGDKSGAKFVNNGHVKQNGCGERNGRELKRNGFDHFNGNNLRNGTELNKNGHVQQNVYAEPNETELTINGHFEEDRIELKTSGYTSQNVIESKTNGSIMQNGHKTNHGYIVQNGVDLSNRHVKQNGAISNGNITRNGTNLKRNGLKTQDKQDCIHNSENINNPNAETTLTDAETKKEKKAHFLLRYAHCFTFPSLAAWVILGSHIMSVDSELAIALYVGMERLMFSLMTAWQLIQIITIKGPWGTLLSWPGWRVAGRLSLSMTMVHWCVSAGFVAARPLPVVSSVFTISVDWLTTLFYSYLVAIPVYVLVEMPMRRSLDALIS